MHNDTISFAKNVKASVGFLTTKIRRKYNTFIVSLNVFCTIYLTHDYECSLSFLGRQAFVNKQFEIICSIRVL